MKEKLELKHLSPYLPYSIFCVRMGEEENKTLTGLSEDYFLWCEFDGSGAGSHFLEDVFPILHPLSDLTKVGEDSINEHSINIMIEEEFNLGYGIFSHYKGELSFELDGDPDTGYDANKTLLFDVTEAVRNELLKGHYDIFNLIPSGLAIDINTIK